VAPELDVRSLPAAVGLPQPRLLARSTRNGVRRGEERRNPSRARRCRGREEKGASPDAEGKLAVARSSEEIRRRRRSPA